MGFQLHYTRLLSDSFSIISSPTWYKNNNTPMTIRCKVITDSHIINPGNSPLELIYHLYFCMGDYSWVGLTRIGPKITPGVGNIPNEISPPKNSFFDATNSSSSF